MSTSSNRWTDIYNMFSPYWTISAAVSESGPAGYSAMQAYVEHEDIRPLEDIVGRMRPELDEHARAVVVGQKGTGKSMDLTWIAGQLSRTHMVLWLDAVGLDTTVFVNPLNLFVAIGLTAIQSAAVLGVQLDQEYVSNLISACRGISTQEISQKRESGLQLDKLVGQVGTWFNQISLPLAAGGAAGPGVFMAAVGSVFQTLAASASFGLANQDSQKQEITTLPRVEEAALRLQLLIQKMEELAEKPVVVIIDGLDRIPLTETRQLCERARALASPDLRLILTAPLALYHAPEFEHLEDYFPHVLMRPGVSRATDPRNEFLRSIIARRLALCEVYPARVLEPEASALLLSASGGNIRQLIMLVREAILETERRGLMRIEMTAAESAKYKLMVSFMERLQRPTYLKALQAFTQAGSQYPPDGEIGDFLLGMNCILAYRDANNLPTYALNPLAQTYMEEVGLT